MFSSTQESHRARHRSSDTWSPSSRPRSHSLNSADARLLHHRTVKSLISDSEDEDGYCEDNEGSSTDDAPHPIKERPRSTAPKDPHYRVKDLHRGSSTHRCKLDSPRSPRGSTPSLQDGRQPLRVLEQHWSQQASPLLGKNGKKRQRPLGSMGRKFPQNTPPAGVCPCRLQQQRPSSAGPAVKNRRQVPQRRIFIKLSSLSYLLLFHKMLFLSVLPSSSGPENRRLLWGFLRFSSRAVVSAQPGGEGAT